MGGILFLDEVHRRPKEFAQALLTPLEDFQGKVMVIIAGYDEKVRKWLRDCDPGLPSRFPRRVEFLPLSADTLVEIGMDRMVDPEEYSVPYSLDPSARDVFRRVMEHVSARAEPCDLPLNGRGAIFAVDDMIRKHDARPGLDDEDMCITTKDILDACPFADPAAAASQHAPATADEGRDGSTSGVSTAAPASTSNEAAASLDASRAQRKGKRAPTPATEAATGGSPRRSSQASSSLASAGPSSADATARATSGSKEAPSDSEEAPLSGWSRRQPAPSKPAAPASGKRKRDEAESSEARAEDELPALSHVLANAIVTLCKLDEHADPIPALDFIKKLAPHVNHKYLRETLLGCKRTTPVIQQMLKAAFDAINDGKSSIVRLVVENKTWYVSGARPK